MPTESLQILSAGDLFTANRLRCRSLCLTSTVCGEHCVLFGAKLASLSNTLFAVLLDEYENLFPFQQRIVNSIVKLAAPDFTVKIAKKLGDFGTRRPR